MVEAHQHVSAIIIAWYLIRPWILSGTPCARTHTSPHVVNEYSKFQRTAGLEEILPNTKTPQLTAERGKYLLCLYNTTKVKMV